MGFGLNGGGIASVRFGDDVRTQIDTRVFRRVRFEDANGRRVANFRDVFVATAVTRTEGGVVTSTIHVDGYATEGDDSARYPMRGFGDTGRVSVALADKSPDWSNVPTGFTVVSRELLAVAFPSVRIGGNDAGVVEYYDLTSGRLDVTLGDKGRVVVPKAIGIDDVHDVSFREIGDDGMTRLVVAGMSYGNDGKDVSIDDVVIAGLTVEGAVDSAVGANGSGTISLRENIDDFGAKDVRDIRLADPGLSQVKGVIGALVTSWIPFSVQTPEFWQRGETKLTGVVARAPRAGGPITMDAANGAYTNFLRMDTEIAKTRNVIFDRDYSLDSHITVRPVDAMRTSIDDLTNDAISFTSPSPTTGVMVRELLVPFAATNKGFLRGNQFTADLSVEGKSFFVEVFNDVVNHKVVTAICFSERTCDINRLPGVRQLIDTSPFEATRTSVQAMRVDADGVHLLVRRDAHTVGGEWQSIVALSPDGSGVVGVPTIVGGDFDTNAWYLSEEGSGTQSVNTRWTDAASILGGRRLAAIGSTLPDAAPNFILLSDAGTDHREIPLSLPLGVRAYSSLSHQTAMLDESSLVLTANVDSDAGRERRLYKLNIANGSVDVTFGTDGWVSAPTVRSDGDGCESAERLVSGPGVVASLVIDHDPVSVDGFENCGLAPTRVSWSAFTGAGEAAGAGQVDADIGSVGFTRVTDYLVDPRGNLYVVGYRDVYEGGRYVTSNAMIAKLTGTGGVDETFGASGVLSLDGSSNSLFGAGLEAVAVVDREERVYVAAATLDSRSNVEVLVMRLTARGRIDGDMESATPGSIETSFGEVTPRQLRLAEELIRESRVAAAAAELAKAERNAELAPDNGLTVTATRPVLTRVKAVEDRSLTVSWSQSAAKRAWVTAIARPEGRSCTSDDGSCVIRGLDPSVLYEVTVVPRGEAASDSASATSISIKPVVTLKAGRVVSPTTYVRPASRGKATWKVRGGCTLNASNTRVTAPKRATTCQLSVTTAKFETTPKTTKRVTIVVTK